MKANIRQLITIRVFKNANQPVNKMEKKKIPKFLLNLLHSSSSHRRQRQTGTYPLHASLSLGNVKYFKRLTGPAEDVVSSYYFSVGFHICLSQTLFIVIPRTSVVIKEKRPGNRFNERTTRKMEQLLFLDGV